MAAFIMGMILLSVVVLTMQTLKVRSPAHLPTFHGLLQAVSALRVPFG